MRKSKTRKKQRRGLAKGRRTPEMRELMARSQFARDRSAHVISAMRRNRKLSFNRAAELEGVKPETVKKYFPSALHKSHGRFVVTESDRFALTLYLFDAQGNKVAIKTRSSKDRKAISRYLRDVGRYLRGKRDALAEWHGKRIAGFELVTAGRTLVSLEPLLSDFSIYRVFNGGAE